MSERAARTTRARLDEARARDVRESAEQRIHELSRAEQARLNEGATRVGDLALLGDWRKGAALELQAQVEREQRAGEALRGEIAAEAVARRTLGVASSEAELIDGHRLEWHAAQEAAREQSEEEAAVEQWTAKRYPPRA